MLTLVLIIFIGTGLGTLSSLYLWSLPQKLRAAARRKVLFQVLGSELDRLQHVPIHQQCAWVLHSPALLLDGHTLDYGRDADLARQLLALRHALDAFNEYLHNVPVSADRSPQMVVSQEGELSRLRDEVFTIRDRIR